MAKGFNKSGLEVLAWEVFRGTGRQTGRQISKSLTKELAKKTLNNGSKFRKAMDKFEITASLKTTLNKMYKIIDLFEEEYTTTQAILQKTWYLKDDVKLIEKKLRHTERLVFTDTEENAYKRCLRFWGDIKNQIMLKNK
tara:strand:+ start:514 stop:930 length:417 start_codon:yes stop_codon:yes gene_type:complete